MKTVKLSSNFTSNLCCKVENYRIIENKRMQLISDCTRYVPTTKYIVAKLLRNENHHQYVACTSSIYLCKWLKLLCCKLYEELITQSRYTLSVCARQSAHLATNKPYFDTICICSNRRTINFA